MFDAMAIATDGSASVDRAIAVGLDLAERFDATIHAVYVIDTGDIDSAPADIREELRSAFTAEADRALSAITDRVDSDVVTAVRQGRPVAELTAYAREHELDLVVTGTRGRHAEGGLMLGSVAEGMVRTCPVPVLTVRHLAAD